jgi:hypothetical protein
MTEHPLVFIGVDPSFREGGFAVCVINRNDNTATMHIINRFMEYLKLLEQYSPAHVIVENSNLQNATFDLTGSVSVIARKSRDVGKNMGISQCAADAAQLLCKYEVSISPLKKGAKIENEAIFQGLVRANGLKLVNYKGNKGEQDKRDALKLALIAEQQYKIQKRANRLK